VNEAHKGRHFPTQKLDDYKNALGYLLPKMEVPTGRLAVQYVFGLSSKNTDGDNCGKAFQDALCEKYGFDDGDIFRWEVEKELVKKGGEFIKFSITRY
jgi:Holliday junction resolvase RusA-like endonuclease